MVAVFYGSQKSAFLGLLKLQDIEHERRLKSVGILDACVMSEGTPGRLCIDRTIEFREMGEQRLTELFTPAVLLHRASGRNERSVSEHFSTLGFEVNLLREIAENLPRDGAALVVMLREEWFMELRELISPDVSIERWAPCVVSPGAVRSAKSSQVRK